VRLADRSLGDPPPPPVTIGLSPLDSLKRRYVEGWMTLDEFEVEVGKLLASGRADRRPPRDPSIRSTR
jgi:hypothetical protein